MTLKVDESVRVPFTGRYCFNVSKGDVDAGIVMLRPREQGEPKENGDTEGRRIFDGDLWAALHCQRLEGGARV